MVLYYNTVREGKNNTMYPLRKDITCVKDLEDVVCYDHVGAEYKDGYRKNINFLCADCSMFDVDNTESDDSSTWISPEDIQTAFPNVPFYISFSRNHMKSKNGKAPRPKFHVYFPVVEFTDMEEYRQHKEQVCRYFSKFDPNAKDPARFFFGVECPEVKYFPGDTLLSDYMKQVPSIDTSTGSQPTEPVKQTGASIPEGERNNTLFQLALSIQRKYGTGDDTYQKLIQESARCKPPLEMAELNGIWRSALKYSSSHTNIFWDELNIIDQTALKELCRVKQENRRFNIKTLKLCLKVFDIKVRLNEMNRRTEICGLPQQFSGEDGQSLFITLMTDFASSMSYRRVTSQAAYEALAVIASENRYHPVLELLNSEPWDNTDRLADIYSMLDITDGLYKTLVKKWAIQTIAILYNSEHNPVSTQGVLVLQGEQGIGKTEFFRHLAICDKYFKGGATLDMSNKDSLMSATKVWICELGEIDSTTKKEQSALKAFLTEQVDRYREPYARTETIRPRRTSFCGTVNPARYLRDETGNRRYWTIPVSRIDVEKVFQHSPAWYAQFWRQVHEMYKQNPKGYLLTPQEQAEVNKNNSAFEAEMHGEDEFMTVFNTQADQSCWSWRTAADITDILNTHYKGLGLKSSTLSGRLLPRIQQRIGKKIERKTIRGKRLLLVPPCSCAPGSYHTPQVPISHTQENSDDDSDTETDVQF